MIDATQIKVDSVLVFKKSHPCGGCEWKVLRTGIDLKLECTTCKRVIITPRHEAIKKIKEIKD